MELQAKGFGSQKEVIAELVFNTSMVGYQEILSDPSYTEQIVVMTYPLIGNYGIIDEDYESNRRASSSVNTTTSQATSATPRRSTSCWKKTRCRA